MTAKYSINDQTCSKCCKIWKNFGIWNHSIYYLYKPYTLYFNIFHSLNFFSIHCTIFRLLEGREYVLFTFPHVTTMNIGMAEYCNVIVFLTAQYILLKRMYRGFMKRNSSWRCFPEKKKIKQIVIFLRHQYICKTRKCNDLSWGFFTSCLG